MSIDALTFPAGLHLLSGWQANDRTATERLRNTFDAGLAGQYDEDFKSPAPQDVVHVSGSIDLLTLGIMFDLYGVTAAELYKGDPERYVRAVLLTLRLLGMRKLYLSWPVYGLTAEALGAEMIYSDRFSPGTDPDKALVDDDNWRDLDPLDFDTGIPKLLDETLACYRSLSGHEPVLHLSAPYSLAADIYGQEQIITALTHEPGFVNEFLDHLADTVHAPWISHFFDQYPAGWVELADASGSPFFIGPRNCKDVAIRSVQRLVEASPHGTRVYIANYRGDYVTQAAQRVGSSSRRRSSGGSESGRVTLSELFEAKNSVCRDYVIRLNDDRIPASFYVEKAIERNVPLFMGIGATELDRNSIADMDIAKEDLRASASERVAAITTVARSIAGNGYESKVPPWPGTVYFEDVSAESSFELIEILVDTATREGVI
ncbi:MAG: hypothetical protein GY720_04820 [bacterium]|nr:hypothetical protein [bacterium]